MAVHAAPTAARSVSRTFSRWVRWRGQSGLSALDDARALVRLAEAEQARFLHATRRCDTAGHHREQTCLDCGLVRAKGSD